MLLNYFSNSQMKQWLWHDSQLWEPLRSPSSLLLEDHNQKDSIIQSCSSHTQADKQTSCAHTSPTAQRLSASAHHTNSVLPLHPLQGLLSVCIYSVITNVPPCSSGGSACPW